MRILIFGATGGVGRHLLEGAEEAGHAVTAFTRTPARLRKSHPGLAVREGDVRDPAAVAAAVRGQDAVVCALGMPLRNKEGLRGAGTANSRVKRLPIKFRSPCRATPRRRCEATRNGRRTRLRGFPWNPR